MRWPILALLASTSWALGPGVTVQTEPVRRAPDGRRATVGVPTQASAQRPAGELAPDTGWALIDSLTLHRLIPAGERLAVKFDSATERLRDTLLPEFLTGTARQAVAVAPGWLKDDLEDNFRRLTSAQQNDLGRLIVECPDKRYYDEVCFQVAHLSPVAFMNLPPQLLVDNVQTAYQIDRELSFVDIVDYGDPLRGGDYYSTTRYRAIASGETSWVEIPKEIYYWWVVMPKITDEQVKYCYDYFWREYLFYVCDSGYPLLQEKLATTTVLWDGEQHNWQNRNQGYPDTLPAVAVVSRWVAHTLPEAAQPPRPIEPIEIARDHNGNCGEVQDLLCAAARTALIPCGGVCDINEDHVWCEIWWQGEFHPWQVDLGGGPTNIKNPGIAYDRKYGGSKQVSGVWDWRNDGWQRSVVGTYSDVCTLTVEVRDSVGRLVDGAVIKLLSEGWGTSEQWNAIFGVTDRSGRYTTTLGDWQNYYLAVSSGLGQHSGGMIIDSASCEPGTHFFYACSLSGRLDSLVVLPDSGPSLDRYRLDVSYAVSREAVYGFDCYNANGANEYALVMSAGAADFLLLDRQGFTDYLSGREFRAAVADENQNAGNHSLPLFRTGDHYAVFSNQEQANLTAFLDATVRLYRRGVGIAESVPGPNWPSADGSRLTANPNPFRRAVSLRLGAGGPMEVRIYDAAGRSVRVLAVGRQLSAVSSFTWDGTDEHGRAVPAGVYFCRSGDREAIVLRRAE